jgi:hypothetical protein
MGRQASALLATLNAECVNADELGQATIEAFRQHPDHAIIASFPGLGDLTGARVLAKVGDDRTRFTDARDLKAYAGSAPETRASGRSISITRRMVKNNRLAAVGFVWAFAAIPHPGPTRRPLPPPARPRRRPHRRATPPVQPHARPALPLPPHRPALQPNQGIPRATEPPRAHRRSTTNKIGDLRTRQGHPHHDPGLAVLDGHRSGDRSQLVDRAVGHPPAGPRRRCRYHHRRAAAGGGGSADCRRAVAARRSYFTLGPSQRPE